MNNVFKPKIRELPNSSGVYLMQDSSKKVLYIGKAINLKKRIASYWQTNKNHSSKVKALILRVKKVNFIVTDNETEALILENELIKKHRPQFNVVLRDDKTYQYIKVDLGDKFPSITTVRKVSTKDFNKKKKLVRYFGPYVSAASVKNVIKLINNIFPICGKIKQLNKTANVLKSPCLNWHLKKCLGVCVGKISKTDYKNIIDKVVDFLSGDYQVALNYLKTKMNQFSKIKKFEEAAKIRDQIKSLNNFFQKQKVSTPANLKSVDFLGTLVDGTKMVVARLVVREGRLINQQTFVMDAPLILSNAELVSKVIKLIYQAVFENLPKVIFVNNMPEDKHILELWLQKVWQKSIKIKLPQKGINKKLLLMANKNAISHSGSLLNITNKINISKVNKFLSKTLKISKKIKRIEAYDISHLGGTYTVASMVVFINGLPQNNEYRRFRIKTVKGIDDYAALGEVITRRLRSKNKSDKRFAVSLPQLILIDGGRGQLNSVIKKVSRTDLAKISFISLAKQQEEIYTINQKQPLILNKTSDVLRLLQQLRDEAHRFALSYQVILRKQQIKSNLEKIPGIGAFTRRKLIKAFGSLAAVKQASTKEINAIVGVSKAKIIKDYL